MTLSSTHFLFHDRSLITTNFHYNHLCISIAASGRVAIYCARFEGRKLLAVMTALLQTVVRCWNGIYPSSELAWNLIAIRLLSRLVSYYVCTQNEYTAYGRPTKRLHRSYFSFPQTVSNSQVLRLGYTGAVNTVSRSGNHYISGHSNPHAGFIWHFRPSFTSVSLTSTLRNKVIPRSFFDIS